MLGSEFALSWAVRSRLRDGKRQQAAAVQGDWQQVNPALSPLGEGGEELTDPLRRKKFRGP
jgi:hypothetical protein